jgi:aquaporin Z
VNPARSTGPAIFQAGWALEQLWLFWLAPIVGGLLGGALYRYLMEEPEAEAQNRVSAGRTQSSPTGAGGGS